MERGEEAVDLLHPDKTAFNMGRHVHFSGNARTISGNGDPVQVELQVIRHGIKFIPRDVLKGMLDLERKLVSRPDGPGRDARIAVAVAQLERRAAGDKERKIRGEHHQEHHRERWQAGLQHLFHVFVLWKSGVRAGKAARTALPFFAAIAYRSSDEREEEAINRYSRCLSRRPRRRGAAGAGHRPRQR